MQFNELVKQLARNPRNLVFIAVGVLTLSVLIGLMVGLARKKALLMEMRAGIEETVETRSEKPLGFALPDPVSIPDETDADFHLYLEEHGPALELLPIRVSDLLKNRNVGVEVDFKPFVFSGEELDVLSPQHELAEP
jgi:hypothetical protein